MTSLCTAPCPTRGAHPPTPQVPIHEQQGTHSAHSGRRGAWSGTRASQVVHGAVHREVTTACSSGMHCARRCIRVHGAWCMVHGAWCMVHASQCTWAHPFPAQSANSGRGRAEPRRHGSCLPCELLPHRADVSECVRPVRAVRAVSAVCAVKAVHAVPFCACRACRAMPCNAPDHPAQRLTCGGGGAGDRAQGHEVSGCGGRHAVRVLSGA